MNKRLYHGTGYRFDGNNIDLKASTRPKDFGDGFYLTSLYNQALSWANRQKRRTKIGIVMNYDYYKDIASNSLKILDLDDYNEKWLDYVLINRNSSVKIEDGYDLVVGLMADGHIDELLKSYNAGFIDKEDLLEELKFMKKNDQYTFKTEKSIEVLEFVSCECV